MSESLKDIDRVELSIDALRTLIDEAVERGKKEAKAVSSEVDYFKATEKLLYTYPTLVEKVKQDEKFLYDPCATASPNERSKDIILFNTKSKGSHGLKIDNYTQSLKSSMMRTKQEVMRIDRALQTIMDDQYYEIIPKKYFKVMTIEKIAEAMNCDESTIRRNKNRLVNDLKIKLFGADALIIRT